MSNFKTKFIITCAPRTGSTMLRMMLNSHPEIVCHGEAITLKRPPNLGKKYQDYIGKTSQELAQIRAENPVNFLYSYIWNKEYYKANSKAVGLKLKYRQLQEEFKEVFQAILEDKEIRIIHLTRRNLLKRYLSNLLVTSGKTSTVILNSEESQLQRKLLKDYFYNRLADSGKTSTAILKPEESQLQQKLLKDEVSHPIANNDKKSTVILNSEESQLQPKIKVDVDKCIEDILSVQQTEAQFRKDFKQHKVFEVVYEELVMSNSKTLAQIMNFLEVDFINIQPVTQKVNSDNLEDIVENYTDLANHIKKTPYATYIQ